MPKHSDLSMIPARATAWLRRLLSQRGAAPRATALSTPRKLPPIEEVVARVGRDQVQPE